MTIRHIHRDSNNIIGQIQKNGSIEGGDSACWQGHHVYLTNDKNNFDYVNTFEIACGAYIRHPHPEQTFNGFGAHYKNPWNGCISRDQLTGILGALIKKKEYFALLRMIPQHLCWLFLFSYNNIKNGVDPKTSKWKWPDITFFNVWAMFLRGFGITSWLMWPLLCILDLHLLIDTVIVNKSDNEDAINYLLRLLVSRDYVPTPISKLCVKLLNKDHLAKLLEKYWTGRRDNPGMYDLQKQAINRLK